MLVLIFGSCVLDITAVEAVRCLVLFDFINNNYYELNTSKMGLVWKLALLEALFQFGSI